MNFKTILKSFKNKDMRKRIFAVVGILVVYRFLAHIPVPLGDQTTFKQAIDNFINGTDFGGFINLISGGGLTNFSILLVGLSPYITASIVMQLLTKAIPRMEELNNDGEAGRRKISQWTRMLAVPLAVLQSIAYIYILFQELLAANTGGSVEVSFQSWALAVTSMTAGSIILMWLGELVTEQGIGNGISTIILCSIIQYERRYIKLIRLARITSQSEYVLDYPRFGRRFNSSTLHTNQNQRGTAHYYD